MKIASNIAELLPLQGDESTTPPTLSRRACLTGLSLVPAAISPVTSRAGRDIEGHTAPSQSLGIPMGSIVRMLESARGLDAETFELDVEEFVTPAALISAMISAVDRPHCTDWQLRCFDRDLAAAKQVESVRYDPNAASVLIARIERHHRAGTHWFGASYGETPSWQTLVCAAIFDLRNLHVHLTGTQDLMGSEEYRPAIDRRAEVSVGAWMFRLHEGVNLIYPCLCGRNIGARGDFVWFPDLP